MKYFIAILDEKKATKLSILKINMENVLVRNSKIENFYYLQVIQQRTNESFLSNFSTVGLT